MWTIEMCAFPNVSSLSNQEMQVYSGLGHVSLSTCRTWACHAVSIDPVQSLTVPPMKEKASGQQADGV